MTQRRKLTSSERHGVIALAVVMAIITAIMAIDRGAFSRMTAETTETAAIQESDDKAGNESDNKAENEADKKSEKTSGKRSGKKSGKRKKSDGEVKKHPGGRERNYLEESAE